MNGVQYWPFPSTSATFYRPAQLSCKACQQVQQVQKVHSLYVFHFARNHQFPLARSTTSPQSSGASDVDVLATTNTENEKNLALNLQTGLSKKRTNFLKRGSPNSVKFSCEELKIKIKIWNDIYSLYKERCPESQRTLQQVKKRQQNLHYEYKQ